MGCKQPLNMKPALFYVQTFVVMYSHIHQLLLHRTFIQNSQHCGFCIYLFSRKGSHLFNAVRHSRQIKIKPHNSQNNPVIAHCRKKHMCHRLQRTVQQQILSSLLSLIKHFIRNIQVVQNILLTQSYACECHTYMTCHVKILSFLNARPHISGKP
jgi:hypothetical protein